MFGVFGKMSGTHWRHCLHSPHPFSCSLFFSPAGIFFPKGICDRVSISTLDQHLIDIWLTPWLTPWLTHNGHLINNILVNSWLRVDWFLQTCHWVSINTDESINTWLRTVDRVSINTLIECQLSVHWVLIKCWLRCQPKVNLRYQFTLNWRCLYTWSHGHGFYSEF